MLTNGQSKLFNFAKNKLGAWFQPGKFASCDYFLELLLSPKKNSAKVLKGLFDMRENREFSCKLNLLSFHFLSSFLLFLLSFIFPVFVSIQYALACPPTSQPVVGSLFKHP
jgi:hypothetical protein